jgi:hypothetical protein
MAKSKIGLFTSATARRIYINAGGGRTSEVEQFTTPEKVSRGIWCITPSGGIAARTGTTVIGATLTGVDCDVVELVNDVITATSPVRKLKVKNAGHVDIPGNVLICPFLTNFGWCAIWEGCDA